jgi:multiple sugar transport system substrate-binding protein
MLSLRGILSQRPARKMIAPALASALLAAAAGIGHAQEPVTIRLIAWGNPTEVEARKATIAMFEETHPNIRVEFLHTPDQYMTKLQTMLAGRDFPDVMFLGNGDVVPFATRRQLLPLDDFIARDGFDTSDISQANLALYNVGGTQYGFPVDAPNLELFYNRDLFEAAAVEPPSADWSDRSWTWEAFLETAQALTDPSRNVWGYQVKPDFRQWWVWVTSNGGSFISEDGTRCELNEAPAVEALQFLSDLIHVHKVAPPLDIANEMGSAELFQSGVTAMETWWPAIGYMRTNVGDKFVWDVAPHPAGDAGKTTAGGGTGHVISASSRHPEEAWEFLSFMISREAVAKWTDIMGIVPPLTSVAQSEVFLKPDEAPEHITVFTAGNAFLQPDPRHPEFVRASQIARSELERLWLNLDSAQEVTDKICREVDRLL